MVLAVGLVVILATVPLAGGTFRGVDRAEVRSGWMMAVAFVAQQLVIGVHDGAVPRVVHVASFGLAGWFLVRNRRLEGTRIVAAGGILNLLAVVANGGVMPASAWAWRVSGGPAIPSGVFSNARPLADAHLLVLGDTVPFPAFVAGSAPFSIGDALILVGLTVVVHHLCGASWTVRRDVRVGRDADRWRWRHLAG